MRPCPRATVILLAIPALGFHELCRPRFDIRCCVPPRPLGPIGKIVVLVGDSTMRAPFEYMCHESESRDPDSSCWRATASTLMFFSNNGFPSHLRAEHVIGNITARVPAPARPRVVHAIVHNFGVLHTLHLFPARTWYLSEADTPAERSTRCGDFRGFDGLRAGPNGRLSWVEDETSAFESGLPGARFILMTPHEICSSRFSEEYGALAANTDASVRACEAWLVGRGARWATSARQLCSEGIFTANSTRRLARTMRDWAERRRVSVLDAAAITANQCALTGPGDGRHYPPLVAAEVAMMRALVSPAPFERGRVVYERTIGGYFVTP